MRASRMKGQYPSQDSIVQRDAGVTCVEGSKVNYGVKLVKMRRCTMCGSTKVLEEDFHKNGVDGNGDQVYRQECKVCYVIKRQENASKNRKRHSDFVGGQKRRGEEAPQLSHQEWKECMLYFGGECAYCGCTTRRNLRLTRDHLDPVVNGGKTTQDNIVPACLSCNSSKGASDFKTWYMAQTFFSQERLNKIFKWRTILRQLKKEDEND